MHVSIVLSLLHEAGVTIDLKQSKLTRTNDYLGNVTRPDKLNLANYTKDVVTDSKLPRSVAESKFFFCLWNVYRKFLAGFACMPWPFNEKLKKGEPKMLDTFMQEEHEALETLQSKLLPAAGPALPQSKGHPTHEMDACNK